MGRRSTKVFRLCAGAFAACCLAAALDNTALAAGPYSFDAGQLTVTLNDVGQISSLKSKIDSTEYTASGYPASLIQLVANGAQQLPSSLTYDASSGTYDFHFSAINTDVYVQITSKAQYATLQVTSINAPAGTDVSVLMWGPITTNITQTVGETVGVVYNSSFAIGIQELNDKTVGGWPNEWDSLTYPNAAHAGPTAENPYPFDWNSASNTPWGSILQAYTYDYTKARSRGIGEPGTGMWRTALLAPLSGPDAQIPGSEIALFGCGAAHVLNTISNIETGEGLPHQMIDGQWQKTAQATSQSFLVLSDLNTTNVAQAAQYANQAGLKYIYALTGVNGPWLYNGSYQFNSSFGGSDAAAAQLVSTAESYGVHVGVHTLSDFIDSDDPYVTPVPNPGLANVGTATLTRSLDTSSTDVYVSNSAPFVMANPGNVLLIDNEIITYSTVTMISSTEWELSGGVRAKWGTALASHNAGATVASLWLNEYSGLVGGITLIPSITARLAQIFNTTGLKAASYDGLESTSQAGYGVYPGARFVHGVYGQMSNTNDFIFEASNIYPNTWDTQSRISLGEEMNGTPMSDVYAHNDYYGRNFMPHMMGWRTVDPSLVTMEWKLSKAASWNAGTGFQTSVAALGGMSSDILDAINQWETARNAGAFTASQEAEMRDQSTYWHLSVVIPGVKWSLQQTDSNGNAIGSPEDVYASYQSMPQYSDLARSATATASSYFDSRYTPAMAVDGQSGTQWASLGELNPWIQLNWSAPQTLNTITFFDRGDGADFANGGTLTFSDGSSLAVSGIPHDGSPLTVTFADRTVTWVKFQVNGGSGYNVGLQEIQAFESTRDLPQENDLALNSTATASSYFDSRYTPAMAIDGQSGTQWASLGELDPWIQLSWTAPQTLNTITFFDRGDGADFANGGTLTFSDNSAPVSVSGIPHDGSPLTVTFPDRTVTWVKFQVSGGSGYNVGLQEIQAFESADVARNAAATASSSFDSRYTPDMAIDGNPSTEWASAGELNPWIALDWGSNQLINQITFYDRQNLTDWAPGGTLTFSDGSSLAVSGIPNDGSPYTVTFPDKNVTWLKFQVANGSGSNVGLQEIQVFSNGIRSVPVTDIAMSPNPPPAIHVGQTLKLAAAVSPTNASSTSVTWSSSSPSIATVDQSGLVTAVTDGTTTITVTSADGKTDTGTITVN